MANELIKGAVSANRDVPNSKPEPTQDCSDVVHISIFFDGTGNNRDKDNAPKSKWSNVARMFDAALNKPEKGIYRIYIAGIGTPYNGKAANWLMTPAVWVEDNLTGEVAGGGGTRRLDQGDDAVNDRLRDVMINNAKALGGEARKYAAANSDKSFAEVGAALDKHRLIKVINLSIFGFSRGAALARAFSNRIIESCEKKGDELLYQKKYPLNMNFMGIFDTVASFGVPSQNVRLPFEERDLIVSTKVERCVHYIAAHEVRFAFPVDLIRKNGKLAGDWLEKTYPGVHADVGGGYEPHEQGIDNNYSRIPMRDMMEESVTYGVRMLRYDDVRKVNFPLFQQRFECKAETETAYKNYMAACGAVSGSIEHQMRQHLKTFYSANGTMHRTGIATPGERGRQDAKYKYLGPKGMAWEIGKYRTAAKIGKWVRVANVSNTYAQYIKPQNWQIAAWDSKSPTGAVDFVAKFIHDSKVDFIGNLAEPFSYFKPRGVEESSNSIWQEGGNWMGNKAHAVGQAAESTYNTGKREAGKAVDASAKLAKDTADAASQKAQEAADFAKRKANEAADAADRAYKATAKAANDAYDATAHATKEAYEVTAKAAKEAADAAQKKATEAANFAERKANEAADIAKKTYDATAKSAKETSATAARKIDEVEEGATKIYEKGKNWLRQKEQEIHEKIYR